MTSSLKHRIDLRSDTVTWPTAEMLEAMRIAPLGDDCYGEDPTANRLETLAAAKVGKEAALFIASGTMGNLCAVLSYTQPGEEIIFEAGAHMYHYECGSYAIIGGCTARLVPGHFGALDLAEVARVIRPRDIHQPKTALICVENTNNRAGGTIIWPEQLASLAHLAKQNGLPIHMDGARIFNAAIASKKPATEFTSHVDSVMFCLSKGLSAPVGSILAGRKAFIDLARWKRKMLGGAMRQAGVLAAAGIIALEKMVERLAEDHENARLLAEGIIGLSAASVNLASMQTNMVYVKTTALGLKAKEFVAALASHGILCIATDDSSVRLVTHRGIGQDDIAQTIEVIRQVSQP